MALIDRTAAAALIPEGEVREIFQGVAKKSVAFNLLTRLPNMGSNVTRLKVLNSLPLVYWQGSDTAKKKTTAVAWENKYIYAEELAVIIPIPEAVINDAEYDIWAEIRPKIEEAIAKKVDQAVFLGDDKPSNFPDGLVNLALSAGHTYVQGAGTFFAAVSTGMGFVEDDGYDVNGILGGTSLKKSFRELQDTTGQIITGSEVGALPRYFVDNGAWDITKAKFVVGDFKQAVFSVRQDITYKLLTEAVIQDPDTGAIVYNLAQDDMVALRVTFRFGWQLPNPVNQLATSGIARLPFAACLPSAHKLVLTLTPATATTFAGTQVVTIAADVPVAKIYYTDDGTAPDATATLYTGPITLSATKTIKAIAILTNYTSSDVASVIYTKSS